jgi:hypothetical protein
MRPGSKSLTPSRETQLFLAFTLIVVGFFMVWLPHRVAGLSFIGLEMGEQAKFLPQVQSGEILPGRSLFYLPPVTAGLMLALLTAYWPNSRWQTWVARALAVALSFLAFPALEALGSEPAEWLWRVLMIALVLVTVGAVALPGDRLRPLSRLLWSFMVLVAVAGALLPTWVYLAVRPAFAELLREPVGIGPGVWFNLAGHLLALRVAGWELARQT